MSHITLCCGIEAFQRHVPQFLILQNTCILMATRSMTMSAILPYTYSVMEITFMLTKEQFNTFYFSRRLRRRITKFKEFLSSGFSCQLVLECWGSSNSRQQFGHAAGSICSVVAQEHAWTPCLSSENTPWFNSKWSPLFTSVTKT